MKRANYNEAIEWIANNDAPGDTGALDVEAVDGTMTVILVADLFDVPSSKVAADVVSFRNENGL